MSWLLLILMVSSINLTIGCHFLLACFGC